MRRRVPVGLLHVEIYFGSRGSSGDYYSEDATAEGAAYVPPASKDCEVARLEDEGGWALLQFSGLPVFIAWVAIASCVVQRRRQQRLQMMASMQRSGNPICNPGGIAMASTTSSGVAMPQALGTATMPQAFGTATMPQAFGAAAVPQAVGTPVMATATAVPVMATATAVPMAGVPMATATAVPMSRPMV